MAEPRQLTGLLHCAEPDPQVSIYRGVMLGLNTADAVAGVQSRRLLEEIAAIHQRHADLQEQVLARRQQAFEAGRLMQTVAADLDSGGSPADAFYVAVRTRPLLTGGLDETQFPELADKTFLHGVKQARAQIEARAGGTLRPEHRVAIERLVWLERVVPTMRALGAWRQILRLMQRWRPAYWTTGSRLHVFGMLALGWVLALSLVLTVVERISHTLGTILSFPGVAWMFWSWASIPGRMTTGPKLKALADEAGLIPYDRRMTTSDARQIIAGLRDDLLRLGAAPGQSSGDACAEADRLEQERDSLQMSVFGRLPGVE